MLRYAVFLLILVMVFTVAVVFAAINPGSLRLDLAFTQIETTTSLAMLGFLAAGWIFGILSAGFFQLRLYAERRQLRKSLRVAEAEINSLRSLPSDDAD